MSAAAPEIPGMEHIGWYCDHGPAKWDAETGTMVRPTVHTEWARRKKHDGWKRKKRPEVQSAMSGKWRYMGEPDEPGCLQARPIYAPVMSA